MIDASHASRQEFGSGYDSKKHEYFSKARRLFVDALPKNPSARLLEVGCGTGGTSAYALAEGKCGWCCGVELCEGPAAEASRKLQRVIVGDIEKIELDLPPGSFDVLLLSEVLEHLVNPSLVLKKLRILMKPGAVVLAGSPNVCHRSVLIMLFKGGWDYQPEGIMDATHLRWFSPRTYRALFEGAGYVVDHIGPASVLGWKASLANKLLFRRFEYLFFTQIYLRGYR
jgi:SAM-dependent methyltransferase